MDYNALIVTLLAEKQQEIIELRAEVGRLSELLAQAPVKHAEPQEE